MPYYMIFCSTKGFLVIFGYHLLICIVSTHGFSTYHRKFHRTKNLDSLLKCDDLVASYQNIYISLVWLAQK